MAAAFALGARLFETRDRDFAETLHRKAVAAYALGERHPGVCQTAPGTSPYFYEEDNWVDDMELGASLLHQLTGEPRYLRDAMQFARREPVTPWMGADTANHYQWYPWHNIGHYEAARRGTLNERLTLSGYYRAGLQAVAKKADNGFNVGIPFIWCSNDLLVSFASRFTLYRRMTATSNSAVRTSGTGLAVRRQPVGHLDGDRCAARRRMAARSAHGTARFTAPRAYRRPAGWPGVPLDLPEPARHSPAARRRVRALQHGLHRVPR
jgi:hypothetical protein